jgi:U3 small nucleolar RNA-associated protein 12
MMKSYRRYEPGKALGVISSVQCNVVYDWSGNMVLSGSGDAVSVWNVRQGSLVSSLQNDNPGYPYTTTGEVSYIARSPDKVAIAAGYSTGEVCIFQYLKSTAKVGALRGHQSGISCLAYDGSGTLLASGGKDSDVVIWDTVSLSGVCRLRGHKDAITGLAFLSIGATGTVGSRQMLVSTSKDTLMKVWDLGTQHCLQTIVGHRCEIWSLAVFQTPAEALKKGGKSSGTSASALPAADNAAPTSSSSELSAASSHCRIVTGAADDMLRAYHVKIHADASLISDNEDVIEYTGCVKLNGERCTHVEFNHDGTLLAALVGKKEVEVFRVRSEAEAKKKLKRRQKRAREQLNKIKGTEEETQEDTPMDTAASDAINKAVDDSIILSDCLDATTTIRASHKVASISICPHTKGPEEQVLLSMINNAMEVFSVRTEGATEGEALNAKKSVIEMQGHRSDVRAIAVSTDGLHIATCSSDGAKLWSTVSFQCVRSCSTGYAVSIAFAPGNRFLVVGTREGQLQVVDCSSGDLVSSTEAHQGALWSLSVHPDGKSLVSGGADHIVRFWDFGVSTSLFVRVLCVGYARW